MTRRRGATPRATPPRVAQVGLVGLVARLPAAPAEPVRVVARVADEDPGDRERFRAAAFFLRGYSTRLWYGWGAELAVLEDLIGDLEARAALPRTTHVRLRPDRETALWYARNAPRREFL